MPSETLHLEEGSAAYGALPLREVLPTRRSRARVLLAAACCLSVAAAIGVFGSSEAPASGLPSYILDLQAAGGHKCLNWVSYCKEHKVCLSKFHVREGNDPEVSPAYSVDKEICPEYLDDCKLFCNECDCPDHYCEAVNTCCEDNCKVIVDGPGTANDDTNPPAIESPELTYGECEWTSSGDGFYKQHDMVYPACPDDHQIFGVAAGGFCCKPTAEGGCEEGKEWELNDGLCALDSNSNPQGAPYCSGYNEKQFCKITFGRADWTDYKFRLALSFRGEMAGALFRVAAPGDPASPHYMYAMNTNGTYLNRYSDASTFELVQESVANIPTEDTTYALSVELVQNEIKLYRDGDLELDVEEDEAVALMGGGVGLVSYKSQITAFNLRILDLEDVSMIGYISVYLTAPSYVSGVFVDGDRLAYPSNFNTDLAESVPFDIIGSYQRLAVQIRGKAISDTKCVDEPPYGTISIAELNACLGLNGSTSEIEYIDLGEDETKESAETPKWSPYDALHRRVMDDKSGSVMDQICNVFGYENFDIASTIEQSDALLNDEDTTNVYPAANGKYDCFCQTLNPDCFDAGGQWSDDQCSCAPEEFSSYIGVFPEKACPAPVTTGKQYLDFFCQGGAGNTAQFNGWAAAFIPSDDNVDIGGLETTSSAGWKCTDSLTYATDSQWYTQDFDVSAWPDAVQVDTEFPLPDNIATANTGEGANAKFIWTEAQSARTVYCVYDRVAAE